MELPKEYWDNYRLKVIADNNSEILTRLSRLNDKYMQLADRAKLDKLFQELAEVARNMKLRIK